jgi:putative peptidoglycan lipid II flippase
MLNITTGSSLKRWTGRTFRFRPGSFRLSSGLYMRKFSITEAATLLLLAYFASKILGVIRQSLFNSLFGAGPAATAYYVAFNIPDTIFNLIAGGALVHALVPVFLAYEKEHGREEVWRFVSLVFNILLVALTAVIIVAEMITPQFVSKVLAPGLTPQEQALTATLTRIMLLQPLILGLSSIATAVLHSKRQFVPSAISIAIYDVGLIAGILVARAVPSVGIYGPTVGLLVSAFCQVAVLVPGLLKLGARYTFTWNLQHPGLRQLLSLLGPNVLTLGVTSVGGIIITSLATYLPDKDSIAAIHNASLLFNFPLTLLGVTLANALLPQITAYATHGRYVRMSWTVWRIVGAATLLSVPAAVLLYVLGRPAISILFQHGAFNGHAAALTNTALLGFAIGLPGQTLGLLIVLGFYALKDALTPLFTSVFELVTHVCLALLLLHLFVGSNVILALPLAASISATLAAVMLCLILFLRLRVKVSKDRGMQRLLKRRQLQVVKEIDQAAPVGDVGARLIAPRVALPHDSLSLKGQVNGSWPGSSSTPSPDDFIDTRPLPASDGNEGLMALVQQHIARINTPDSDPVVLMEMLENICRHLSNAGQEVLEHVVHTYKQAAAINARAYPLQFVLGELYFRSRSYDKAVDAYMLAMQYGSFELVARVRAAQCLIMEGLPGVAILQLEQAQKCLDSFSASPSLARVWQARPLMEDEIAEPPDTLISQLLSTAMQSKSRQEQMHSFLRRVNQTPSSYHEVAQVKKQFVTGPLSLSQQHIPLQSGRLETQEAYDELAEIYKIQSILHETIAKLCEQVVASLSNNQVEEARAAMQRISSLYMQLGNAQEAGAHMLHAEKFNFQAGKS